MQQPYDTTHFFKQYFDKQSNWQIGIEIGQKNQANAMQHTP